MDKRIIGSLVGTVLLCISAHASNVTRHNALVAFYTDPGSGILLLQLLTTGGLMLAFYFSRARKWLAKQLGLENRANEDTSSSSLDSEESADRNL